LQLSEQIVINVDLLWASPWAHSLSRKIRAIQNYFLVILGFSEGRFTTVLVIQNPKITKDHFTVFDPNALSKSRIDTKQCFKTYSTHLNTFISVIKSTVVFKQCHVS
jgi:hypothetical protein